MANETEQLNLVVQLTDNASGGLARLRGELSNVGSGQQTQQLQRFKNELSQVHRITHNLADEFIGLSRSIPVVGRELGIGLTGLMGTLGPVGLGIAAVGGAIAAVALEVTKFASELRNIRNLSGTLGIEPSTLKVFQDRAREVGVSAEVVTSSLQGMKRAMSDLYKPGFGALGESLFTKIAVGEGLETRRFLEDLKGMTDEERFNAIIQKANNVFQNELNDTRSKLKPEGDKGSAAALRAQYLAEFGLDEQMIELKNVAAMTKEQAKEYNERTNAATDAKTAQGELATELHRLNEELFASVAAMDALTSLLTGATEAMKHIAPANMPGWAARLFKYTIPGIGPPLAMYDLYKFLRSLYGSEPKGATSETGPQGLLDSGMMGATGADDKAVAANTAELRRLNDILALTEDGTGGTAGAGGGPGGTGGGMMRGLGGLPGFGGRGGAGDGGGGTGPGETPLRIPTSPSEAPESIDAAVKGGFMRPGAGVTGGDFSGKLAPRLGGKGDPRGLESYIRETAAKYGIDPDIAVRVARSEGLGNPVGDRGMSHGAFQLYSGGGLGNVFKKETGLDPADPKNEKATIDFALRHAAQGGWGPWHGAANTGISRWQGIGGRPSVARPGTVGPLTTGDIAGLRGDRGAAASMPTEEGDIRPAGGSGGRFNVRAGTPLTGARETVTLANGQKVVVNARSAAQFKGFFDDLIKAGAPVRNLGGFGTRGNPSQHPIGFAIDWAQHSRNVVDPDVQAWINRNQTQLSEIEQKWGMSGGEHWRNPDTGHFSIDTLFGSKHLAKIADEAAADRRVIDDRAKDGDVNVEVNGKLTANVRAPKNAEVSVEGGGAFKKTETNRTMPTEQPVSGF